MTCAFPALVLNADYQPLSDYPLSLWGLERAMRKVMKGVAIRVEDYDVELRSPSTVWVPPSVVALKRYVPPPRTVAFTRFNLFLRDRFTCQYCDGAFRANELTFDHVVPRSKGGGTNWTNIVAACHPCNTAKADRRMMKPLRPPREPTVYELNAVKRLLPPNHLHHTWRDYVYWDVGLERSDTVLLV